MVSYVSWIQTNQTRTELENSSFLAQFYSTRRCYTHQLLGERLASGLLTQLWTIQMSIPTWPARYDHLHNNGMHVTGVTGILSKTGPIGSYIWILGPPLVELFGKNWEAWPWCSCVTRSRLWSFKNSCLSQLALSDSCLLTKMCVLSYYSCSKLAYMLPCYSLWGQEF